jgi:hypothetical protein
MKTLLFHTLMILLPSSLLAQGSTNLVFNISNNSNTPLKKVQIRILNQNYILTPNSPLYVTVSPTYKSPLQIDCKASSTDNISYFFIPAPNQTYEFEIANNSGQITISLKNIDNVKLGLLEGVVEKPIAQQTDQSNNSNFNINRKNMGISYNYSKEGKTITVRDEWLKKGGKVNYFSVGVLGTYFKMNIKDYGDMTGFGGGFSLAMNRINLTIPEYKQGLSKWNSYNIGAGMDIQIYNTSYKMELSGMKMDSKTSNFDILIAGNLGWTWGFGKFIDEATWKGVAVTVKYRPSFRITSSNTEITMVTNIMGEETKTTTSASGTDGSINFGGFGLDLDFNSFNAKMQKLAPKPCSKLSFFFLPPIGNNPLFITISYGLTFYTK